MKPLLFTLALIQCATLAYYLRPEPKAKPPQPKPVYTFVTADTVFSERQKLVYNEIWEK